MVKQSPKVSMKIPSEWTENSEEVERWLDAMGAKWYQDIPFNLHRITDNPELRQTISEKIDGYKRFRRNRLSRKLEEKDRAYHETQDSELQDVRDFLSDEGLEEVKRAEVIDAYPDLDIPEDNFVLPRGERDIVAVLDHDMDLDTIYEAAQELGLEPSYIGTDKDSIYHDNQRVSVILPETHAEPDARMGMSVSFRPDKSRYLIGGANHERNGVIHREPGNAYQPFHNGEASWNLKLLKEYQEII